jgi:hypothetical protein
MHIITKQVLSILMLILSGWVHAQPTPQSIELGKLVPIDI